MWIIQNDIIKYTKENYKEIKEKEKKVNVFLKNKKHNNNNKYNENYSQFSNNTNNTNYTLKSGLTNKSCYLLNNNKQKSYVSLSLNNNILNM